MSQLNWHSTKENFHEKGTASNKTEIIEFLMNKGCNVDEDDDDEQSALHKAAMFGHAEAVKFLLKNGADANKSDGNGNTPLHMAIITGGDAKVTKTLITKANPCLKNNKGQLKCTSCCSCTP